MSEFWLWFIRPVAEAAGVIVMGFVAGSAFVVLYKLLDWQRMRRVRKGMKR